MKELKRFEFSDILGWSVTRYSQFKTCQRQYFYNYYWKFDPKIDPEYLFELKRMTTIPLEIGNIVHDLIKVLLERLKKTTQPIDVRRFNDYSRRLTERYCGNKTFAEVYYKQMKGIDTEEIHKKIMVCMENLFNSHRFKWLSREAIPGKEDWLIEPPGYGETRIDGLKAYCKVDFLFPVEDKLVIIDWKTGKPSREKHRRQLIGYTAWASFHFDRDPEEILPITAHLYPEYEEREIRVNEFDIQEFSLKIQEETREMQAKCLDVEKNIPAAKETFPQTSRRTICKYCNFRELCGIESF